MSDPTRKIRLGKSNSIGPRNPSLPIATSLVLSSLEQEAMEEDPHVDAVELAKFEPTCKA